MCNTNILAEIYVCMFFISTFFVIESVKEDVLKNFL